MAHAWPGENACQQHGRKRTHVLEEGGGGGWGLLGGCEGALMTISYVKAAGG